MVSNYRLTDRVLGKLAELIYKLEHELPLKNDDRVYEVYTQVYRLYTESLIEVGKAAPKYDVLMYKEQQLHEQINNLYHAQRFRFWGV